MRQAQANMEGTESGSQAFVIAGQAAEAGSPGKASLHHPAARQQNKASFGLSMFHHFQGDSVLFGGLGRSFRRYSPDPRRRSRRAHR